MAKQSARTRGASKRQAGGNSKRQLPAWVWLFTGVVSGLFIAFLFHLAQLQQQAATASSQAGETQSEAEPQATDERLPEFDFYAVLPKMEVVLPKEDELQQQPEETEAAEEKVATQHENHQETSPSQDDGTYLLQAGSFQDESRAQRLRAEFTLQGYKVQVQPGVLDSGETWYRVMIGPFDSKAAMRRAQDKLGAQQVDTLAIQVKS